MKKILFSAILYVLLASCSEPLSITANPSDHTTTTGTVGSAKSTTQLPPKAVENKVIDSLKMRRDSVPD